MTRRTMILAALAGPATAQSPERVEIEGIIERFHFARQESMPTIEVRRSGEIQKVLLGSMRYLMEHNFNPKAGERVHVTALRVHGVLAAIRVRLPQQGRTLVLRDNEGHPLWRRCGPGCRNHMD